MVSYGLNVSFQAAVFGTFYGAALEKATVVVFGHLFPLFTRHAEQFAAGLQQRLLCGCGEAVPRACGGAAVAAIDGVAHLRGNHFGNVVAAFDGMVGNAAPCVERVFRERMGGAVVDALPAVAATVGHGLVAGHLDVEKNFPQEEHAVGVRDAELVVAPSPTYARLPCPIAFQNGRGVGEDAEEQ